MKLRLASRTLLGNVLPASPAGHPSVERSESLDSMKNELSRVDHWTVLDSAEGVYWLSKDA